MERNSQSYFLHADGLGSITHITDQNRNLVQSYSYDSFGHQTPTTGFRNSITYTAREWDKETGLYYYRARYYDPIEGRFISKDPIGFAGGDVNLFAYVGNNSPNYTDPSGLVAGDGPEICQYYEEKCKQSKECNDKDNYACEAKKCCESFKDTRANRCTRKCLIERDINVCRFMSGSERDRCRYLSHWICYSYGSNCWNAQEGWNSNFGTKVPPACQGAANAIGGMGLW